ncbi:MAG: MOSC domain-containing protein [Dehalococcoidia bacterium]
MDANDHLWRVISVNVGQPKAVRPFGADGIEHTVVSGIFKAPVAGRVHVRWWGLEGDGQADTRVFNGRQVHGGEYKAVYLYPVEHYEAWSAELGRELPFGQFGENLTVSGLLEHDIRIGDVLRAGEALLRVTEPRGPCYKLDIRMGTPEFKERMRATGRTGFYAAVVKQGDVAAGDAIDRVDTDRSLPTVLDVHRGIAAAF